MSDIRLASEGSHPSRLASTAPTDKRRTPTEQTIQKRREAWFRKTGKKARVPGAWTLDPDFDEGL